MIMMMPNQRIEAEDINIDEYLSNDETPDYKTQTSNYTMMMIAKHHLLPVSFHQDLINQLNTFILNDEERELLNSLLAVLIWVISVVAYQIW
jgi:RNA polymerase sigma-54 factor